MVDRSVQHSTFVIERTYAASPARTFAAWSDADTKARWFAGPENWKTDIREQDFRIGGRERVRGIFPDGKISDFDAYYHDIVANQRIVYAYSMYVNEKRISVSLSTVEIEPAGAGTKLKYTEQCTFLDGYDDAGSREQGTRWLLDKIAASLSV
jgi:uncharacterized protein YndB with AHSA1/START domain